MRLTAILFRNLYKRADFGLHQLNFKTTEKVKSKTSELYDLLVSMPKDPVHVPQLKLGRTVKKEVNSKFPAGFVRLEVLGNGAKGAPASLYLFTDQTRYLFNCGEGTQRLAHEYKMKLAKLEHIFITNSSWKHIGGLPGAALTIQDIGVPSIMLHGPPGLENFFEGTRRFVILKDLKVSVADPEVGFYEDHVMRIDYVPLLPSTPFPSSAQGTASEIDVKKTELDDVVDEVDYYAPIKGSKRNLEIEGQGSCQSIRKKLKPDEGPSGQVFCYICRPKPKPGALLIQKCIDFGVPAGPLLGRLKRGDDVTLTNGNTVRALDVRSPDNPATVFIVVDCPNEDYLDGLVNNPTLSKHQGDDLVEDDFVHVMIHFTPADVFTHPKYIAWMQKFRMSTKHILLNELSSTGMGSEAVHRAQFQLNVVDDQLFPLLKDLDNKEELVTQKESLSTAQLPLLPGATLLRFNLRPALGVDATAQVKINGQEFIREVMALPDFEPSMESLKIQLNQNNSINSTTNQERASRFPKITFLGTGSCIPNKTRNTSGILLEISPVSSMLLDCGEGTYGQLVRFFGSEVESVLVKVNAIYVSHLHADHHLGLINLLQQRHAAMTQLNVPFRPVYLVCPHQILYWLRLYHRNFEPLSHLYEIVPNASILIPEASIEPAKEAEFYKVTGLSKIQTVGVRHCPNAYGVSVVGQSGWKVTYSGDTMPCDSLVALGKDSDLLIHEATMEDELKEEAVIKMHSTVTEAIEAGKKMKAKFTMLTHFSQRYAKVPKINGGLESNVGIAFDNMTICLADLWKVPLMYPTFKIMFAESYDEMEIKTAKKLRRRERELEEALT